VVRQDQDQAQNVAADLDALKADLAKLRGDLAQVAGSWMDRGRDQALSAADDIKDRFQDSMAGAEDWVKERPLTAVLIAAGIGLVLGKLSSRR
jgi:ElaB/YqjD/DUF883 family membrane-anchored ribosome-binding protein